jgi:hypothetical protein
LKVLDFVDEQIEGLFLVEWFIDLIFHCVDEFPQEFDIMFVNFQIQYEFYSWKIINLLKTVNN